MSVKEQILINHVLDMPRITKRKMTKHGNIIGKGLRKLRNRPQPQERWVASKEKLFDIKVF